MTRKGKRGRRNSRIIYLKVSVRRNRRAGLSNVWENYYFKISFRKNSFKKKIIILCVLWPNCKPFMLF